MSENYSKLRESFDNALEQASGGKGKERHAKEDQRFEDQVMCNTQRMLVDHPLGGLAYQVIKKTIESGRLYHDVGADAARAEIYGAMNYLGGMDIIYKENQEPQQQPQQEITLFSGYPHELGSRYDIGYTLDDVAAKEIGDDDGEYEIILRKK